MFSYGHFWVNEQGEGPGLIIVCLDTLDKSLRFSEFFALLKSYFR